MDWLSFVAGVVTGVILLVIALTLVTWLTMAEDDDQNG